MRPRRSTAALVCWLAALLTIAAERGDGWTALLLVVAALVGSGLVLDAAGRLAGRLANRRRRI